jgi:hypothetical protein
MPTETRYRTRRSPAVAIEPEAEGYISLALMPAESFGKADPKVDAWITLSPSDVRQLVASLYEISQRSVLMAARPEGRA